MVAFEKIPRPVRAAIYTGGGIRNALFRYGPEYFRFRKFLRQSMLWDLEAQNAWQKSQIVELVKEASRDVPFYSGLCSRRDHFDKDGQTVHSVLSHLPLLEKKVLKSRTTEFFNPRRWGVLKHSTSGSTGSPLSVFLDWQSIQRRQALLDDHLLHCGVDPRSRSVRLSGRLLAPAEENSGKPWLLNPAEKQLFVSTYHLSGASSKAIAERANRFQPTVVDGYPSAIIQLLRAMKMAGNVPSTLKLILTTAETLADDTREEIEDLSGAVVCDYYSASEGVPFIQQCRHGTYHVRWQSGVFEILDNTSKVTEGGDGIAVATSFTQFKTPLIRYVTGDILSGLDPNPEACDCGWHTSIVDQVQGRVEDLVVTRDGRRIGMFTYRTLKFVSGLSEAQVIQKDYGRFVVRCVLDGTENADVIHGQIAARFSRAIGEDAEIELEVRDSLPRGPNGKLRLVMSEIA